MDKMKAALAALRSDPELSITDAAKHYGCGRSGLSKRFNGKTSARDNALKNQQFLNRAQSNALIKHIHKLTERSLPPTISMLRNIAFEIKGERPGHNWPT
ncbi:uncharacterized protein BDZ99DRAFT_540136 [Mytilinidion resinicola]|uniref:HTH psq-type domain-containing protein n=1 Tax=Mytilinidion resinicola TaxID=574789 RepID=A0A6A6YC56_9PEZI|nr:uncharacterized protein BDZ99DRAFT_540136 [Mytilinidion resinicola]KAF2805604.1 hypothetical protein BDZ99DRAFT_540136 [Mytilinidion resinicola]